MAASDKIKIVLVGDSRVGKTSLRKRYMGEGFRGTYTATLGADFSVKQVHDKTVTIYDLAGDPASRLIRQPYYFGAQGFILVFDVANKESFDNLPKWIDEIRSNLSNKLRIFVLGNKEDLREAAGNPIPEDIAYQYCRNLELELGSSISYMSTSALTGYNVEVAFSKLITEIIFN